MITICIYDSAGVIICFMISHGIYYLSMC
eukprot:UN20560